MSPDDVKKKRFLWGLLLTWSPWLPTMIGLPNAFRGSSTEKATGLAAVAGGLTEMFVLVGTVSTLVFQIVAIVLFVRTFEGGHWVRNLICVVSIFVSVLLLALIPLFVLLSRISTARG